MNLNEYQNYHETKSHTASEFPYTTYLCSIPLDFTHVPQHWHSELELIVIKKGKFPESPTSVPYGFSILCLTGRFPSRPLSRRHFPTTEILLNASARSTFSAIRSRRASSSP